MAGHRDLGLHLPAPASKGYSKYGLQHLAFYMGSGSPTQALRLTGQVFQRRHLFTSPKDTLLKSHCQSVDKHSGDTEAARPCGMLESSGEQVCLLTW